MKIIDGLKLKGAPAEIPDCSRDDLPQFFKDMGYRVGVEIGTFKGDFALLLCKAGLKLYAIDPWKDYSDYHRDSAWQKELDGIHEQTKKLLALYDCEILRKSSMEMVNTFADESLDFVYIDGNHSFKYVVEDIFEWSKKVKKGGVISGHDYIYIRRKGFDEIHVKFVVDAYTKAFGIDNWYVLGSKAAQKGEKRDTSRSWMWIKK